MSDPTIAASPDLCSANISEGLLEQIHLRAVVSCWNVYTVSQFLIAREQQYGIVGLGI